MSRLFKAAHLGRLCCCSLLDYPRRDSSSAKRKCGAVLKNQTRQSCGLGQCLPVAAHFCNSTLFGPPVPFCGRLEIRRNAERLTRALQPRTLCQPENGSGEEFELCIARPHCLLSPFAVAIPFYQQRHVHFVTKLQLSTLPHCNPQLGQAKFAKQLSSQVFNYLSG